MSILFPTNEPKPCKHGTIGGYMCHRRRKEEPCSSCKRAWRQYYQKKRGATPRALIGMRNPDRRFTQ